MNRRQMLKGLANSALVIASAASTASRSQHAVKGTTHGQGLTCGLIIETARSIGSCLSAHANSAARAATGNASPLKVQ